MTNEEYLEERAARDRRAETHLRRYVDVALPEGEYTQEQREEAVSRMAHDVAVMQHQTSPDRREQALEQLAKAGMCGPVVVCPPPVDDEGEGTYGGPYQRHPKYPPGRDSKD